MVEIDLCTRSKTGDQYEWRRRSEQDHNLACDIDGGADDDYGRQRLRRQSGTRCAVGISAAAAASFPFRCAHIYERRRFG